MPSTGFSIGRRASPDLAAVAIILILALAVAAIGPFDRVIVLATGGVALLRAAVTAALVILGAVCAERAGLSLRGKETHWPWIALGFAVGVAVYVVLVDTLVFRNALPPGYVQAIQTESVRARLSYYFPRAFQEEVIYRLFVFSTLMMGISRVRGTIAENFPLVLVWMAAFAAQVLNVGINALAVEPVSAIAFAYDTIRYVVPGTIWGWLYWRYGFAAGASAHVACHAFLQPALGFFF